MKKVFIKGNNPDSRAYYGWQDGDLSLFGLREGYKEAADNLVDIALFQGSKGDIKTLDTYIFPIIFCYRHSLELSLKHIYFRFYGKIPDANHDLLKLFDIIKAEVIDAFNSNSFIEGVKEYKKESFRKYTTNNIDFDEIKHLLIELQGIDNKADVWRYLMDKKGKLYFTENEFVDYKNLKSVLDELYEVFDFIYHIVDDYLSGDPI
ncbi:MAG: hypothetical protein CVU87_02665 [Firmicutes bacterium HGW-Firmicutes-12]|nr:MAG: hypothetical protein CVU87_02665 [Firmicutes bacterium HGW-Firmicutes-12]